jgi:hypothetical protein
MNTDNATNLALIGGFMPLKTSTTRALAASLAFVAAGATVAGAAVFHLPVLGFGRAPSAHAAVPVTPVAARKVVPRKVVRTRIVTDIVHRPAPPSAAPARARGGANYVRSRPITPVAVGGNPSLVTQSSQPQAVSAGTFHDSEDSHEGPDDGPPPAVSSTTGPATNRPDQ